MKKFYLLLLLLIFIPFVSSQWTGNILYNYTDSGGSGSIDNARHFYYDSDTDVVYVPSVNDDYFTSFNVSQNTMVVLQSLTKTSNPGTLDGARAVTIDDRKRAYICASTDHTISTYDVSNPSDMTILSNYTRTSLPYSVEGCWDVKSWRKGDQYYLASVSITDDTIVIFNATGTNLVPIANFTKSANPCSVDNPRDITLDLERDFMIVPTNIDNSFSIYNISNPSGTLQCLNTYFDSVSPFSAEGLNQPALKGTKFYGATYIDSEFVIYNITDNASIVPLGSYINTTLDTDYSMFRAYSVLINDYEIAYVGSAGNSSSLGRVVVFNVSTDVPIPIGYINSSDGTCKMNLLRQTWLRNNSGIFYAYSSDDDCFYIINGTNYSYTEPESSQCVYSGTGNFVQNNTVCNITTPVNIQSGYDWIIQNSTVYSNVSVNGTNVRFRFLSGGLHWLK